MGSQNLMKKARISVYDELSDNFPRVISATKKEIDLLVGCLLSDNRDDVTDGSSFAVTVDGSHGTWRLWMSETSYRYLRSLDDTEIY